MDGEETLFFIEIDIKKKYNVGLPNYLINEQLINKQETVIDWINENYWNDNGERFWVKYKYISNNLFKLKMFIPDPPIDVCQKLIEEYIDFVKEKTQIPYFKIGPKIYCETEATIEMLKILQDGLSVLFHHQDYFPDPDPIKNRIIYQVFTAENELYWDIESGYRTFEHK